MSNNVTKASVTVGSETDFITTKIKVTGARDYTTRIVEMTKAAAFDISGQAAAKLLGMTCGCGHKHGSDPRIEVESRTTVEGVTYAVTVEGRAEGVPSAVTVDELGKIASQVIQAAIQATGLSRIEDAIRAENREGMTVFRMSVDDLAEIFENPDNIDNLIRSASPNR